MRLGTWPARQPMGVGDQVGPAGDHPGGRRRVSLCEAEGGAVADDEAAVAVAVAVAARALSRRCCISASADSGSILLSVLVLVLVLVLGR